MMDGGGCMDTCVSVIVPVYNVEKYIGKCVNSLRQQAYTKLEIILVDDGSTDSSYDICAELANSDHRIKLFHQNNRGVASARNKGLKEATGMYVTFVDADDTVRAQYIEKMYHAFNVESCDIVFCGYEYINIEIQTTTYFCLRHLKQGNLVIDFSRLFFSPCGNGLSFIAAKLFRMDIIRQYGIQFDCQYSWGEDQIFNLTYFSHMKKYCFLPDALYQYYKHNRGSAVETYSKTRVENETSMVKRWRQWLWQENIAAKEKILSWKLAVLLGDTITGYMHENTESILKKYDFYRNFLSDLQQEFSSIDDAINFKQLLVVKSINHGVYFPVFVYYYFLKSVLVHAGRLR
jgi:glycosyltransferase involved in cell wall biosynthesis